MQNRRDAAAVLGPSGTLARRLPCDLLYAVAVALVGSRATVENIDSQALILNPEPLPDFKRTWAREHVAILFYFPVVPIFLPPFPNWIPLMEHSIRIPRYAT